METEPRKFTGDGAEGQAASTSAAVRARPLPPLFRGRSRSDKVFITDWLESTGELEQKVISFMSKIDIFGRFYVLIAKARREW